MASTSQKKVWRSHPQRTVWSGVFTVSLLALLVSCSQEPTTISSQPLSDNPANDPIKIGIALPLTGDWAVGGTAVF